MSLSERESWESRFAKLADSYDLMAQAPKTAAMMIPVTWMVTCASSVDVNPHISEGCMLDSGWSIWEMRLFGESGTWVEW